MSRWFEHRAKAQAGEEQIEELETVRQMHGNAIARRHTPLLQGKGDAVGPSVDLAKGEYLTGAIGLLDFQPGSVGGGHEGHIEKIVELHREGSTINPGRRACARPGKPQHALSRAAAHSPRGRPLPPPMARGEHRQ